MFNKLLVPPQKQRKIMGVVVVVPQQSTVYFPFLSPLVLFNVRQVESRRMECHTPPMEPCMAFKRHNVR